MSVDARISPEGWSRERSFAQLTAAPWANGLGSTTELVAMEASRAVRPELGAPEWRLSIAELRKPAAFSALPGVHRNFMPVGGDVVLVVDGVRHDVPNGTVLRFSGDADVSLVSLSSPCHAVNLMSPSDALRLRISLPSVRAAVTAVSDPDTPTPRPLAAVALVDSEAARPFDLFVPQSEPRSERQPEPRPSATSAPPFPAAIIELA